MRVYNIIFVYFFKQKTADEMRISDWSSDVCASDLGLVGRDAMEQQAHGIGGRQTHRRQRLGRALLQIIVHPDMNHRAMSVHDTKSEEHTSELQSLMRISYAVFCLKKKRNTQTINQSVMIHISKQSQYTVHQT